MVRQVNVSTQSRTAHRVQALNIRRAYLLDLVRTAKSLAEFAIEEAKKYHWDTLEENLLRKRLGDFRYGIICGINASKKQFPIGPCQKSYRTHRRGDPHCCVECGKTFRYSANLFKHEVSCVNDGENSTGKATFLHTL
jgi:hypothetical protein